MKLIHQFYEHPSGELMHRIKDVHFSNREAYTSDWATYRNMAVLDHPTFGKVIAVTDYWIGSEPFIDCNKFYYLDTLLDLPYNSVCSDKPYSEPERESK